MTTKIIFSTLILSLLGLGGLDSSGQYQCSNPCSSICCDSKSKCWWDPYSGRVNGCINRCTKGSCPPGYDCNTVDGNCPDQSCLPAFTCTPKRNPCINYCKKPNERCWYDDKYKPHCEDPCARVRCSYKCKNVVGDCGCDRCPPKATCYTPCDDVPCKGNSLCYYNASCPQPVGKCLNPCLTAKCKGGFKCRTERGWCKDSSCPPMPHCYNPCEDVKCEPNNLCWFDGNKTICENPCAYTDCFPSFFCSPKPNPICPNQTCPPVGSCSRPYPPASCDNINCGKAGCILVNTLEYPLVPICKPNPCIDPVNKCCSVRTSNGQVCKNDRCYLLFKNNSCRVKGEPCKVEQVCLNPCEVENVQCPKGTFCYTDEVVCITAPCDNVVTCRTACNKTGGISVCNPGQKCKIIPPHLYYSKKDRKPAETCVADGYY